MNSRRDTAISIGNLFYYQRHHITLIADPDLDWKTLRETYEGEESFKVPSIVLSYPKDVPVEVKVER